MAHSDQGNSLHSCEKLDSKGNLMDEKLKARADACFRPLSTKIVNYLDSAEWYMELEYKRDDGVPLFASFPVDFCPFCGKDLYEQERIKNEKDRCLMH